MRSPAPRSGCRSSSPARSPALQGYSFAKFGARYPSAGGLLEYVAAASATATSPAIIAWLTYVANAIITAMVAVSFGSYASAMFAGGDAAWTKVVRRAHPRWS